MMPGGTAPPEWSRVVVPDHRIAQPTDVEGCRLLALADMHVHVDFMANAEEVAADAARDGLALFANTVTPHGYLAASEGPWARSPNVRLGLGMHPWWVADGRVGVDEAKLCCRLAREARFVGEVGLDFSEKHTAPDSHERQVEALRHVLEVCGSAGDRVISLHSVRSADLCLDLLEETGCLSSCSCIFHWFSGSTPALWRAIRSGCYFSVNEMQAGTRRAKEQLKLVPEDRLLLETDLPPGEGVPFSAKAIEDSLAAAAGRLASIRGEDAGDIIDDTTRNATRLLDGE